MLIQIFTFLILLFNHTNFFNKTKNEINLKHWVLAVALLSLIFSLKIVLNISPCNILIFKEVYTPIKNKTYKSWIYVQILAYYKISTYNNENNQG
ncbi:hypothetical protein AS4_10060 [Acinetobacter guillouiae]|nr:hypothetical protein AS4_10060 [Acinetobacter guillouiae]